MRRGSLPIWRRDEDGPRTLRISKKGLHAIQVEDEAAEPAKKPPARASSARRLARARQAARPRDKTTLKRHPVRLLACRRLWGETGSIEPLASVCISGICEEGLPAAGREPVRGSRGVDCHRPVLLDRRVRHRHSSRL